MPLVGSESADAGTASRRYANVTVLERDTLPYAPVPRRGVPQGEHPHILLVGGLRELAALRPGFAARGLRQARIGRRAPAVQR